MKIPISRVRRAKAPFFVEPLESRIAPAAAFSQFVDPHPAPGNQFGFDLVVLSTGNVVITSPFDDFNGPDTGAVYLFNGATGALISELHGSSASDQVGFGGVTALTNGNFVVSSPGWDNGGLFDAGAVTWGSGTTGISGTVSQTNSLVGTTANDIVGGAGGVTALSNGNYVVGSSLWKDGGGASVGAATWGNGISGSFGAVDATNSLVGSTAGDAVGSSILPLGNTGNYVVTSFNWDNTGAIDAGAVTWGNGSNGSTVGAVSAANSLVGTTAGDQVGFNAAGGLIVLNNGNYVVSSIFWDNGAALDAGAATWGSGTTGVSGSVSAVNSLVGSTNSDQVGSGLRALSNGNYVVLSVRWNDGAVPEAGAATWGSGTAGVIGGVSAANSLVGSQAFDQVGSNAFALTNGNYVVLSSLWDNGAVGDAGAATWGDGTTGISGVVSSGNSLVGSTSADQVSNSGVVLSNGNYVVLSPSWNSGGAATFVGAATWGDGTTGISGVVSSGNSLVGSTSADQVSNSGVVALTNGNYVVLSPEWDNGGSFNGGAATWGDGTTGISGSITSANSLVGDTLDRVGSGAVALTNGNYVVRSPLWNFQQGAATWGNGTTGVTGLVGVGNSLVGNTPNDRVGAGVTALTNGNYVVVSYEWDNGAIADTGAVTWGNGTTGVVGAVSAANSLVGSTENDHLGYDFSGPVEVTALSNGHYVVKSPDWDSGLLADAGAITFGDGTTGVVGTINSTNSGIGATASTALFRVDVDAANMNFFGTFASEGGGVIRVGAFADGFALPGSDTLITLTAGDLLVAGSGNDDVITIVLMGANVRISDLDNLLGAGPGTTQVDTHTVDVPFASITGTITFDALAGTDVLVLDLSGGNPMPSGGIFFAGGADGGAGDDSIEIAGGLQSLVTYNFTNTNDGNVVLASFGTLNFTGLGLITDFGSANDIIFNLPAAGVGVLLDDGTPGDTLSQLSSTSIPTVQFANPLATVALNRGTAADNVVVLSLPDLTADLTFGSVASPFNALTFFGATIALGSGRNLTAFASGTIDVRDSANLSTAGFGAITLTTLRDIVFSAGSVISTGNGNLTLSANAAGTTTGSFIGIDLNSGTVDVGEGGILTITASGGNGAGSQHGLRLSNGAFISGGADVGELASITGLGGNSTNGNASVGILFDGGVISSHGGDVAVTGVGGTGGTAGESSGIYMIGASSVITSAGTVAVTGTGGDAVGSTNTGVDVRTGATILSTGGTVTVTGTGGPNPASVNPGVRSIIGSLISTGTGGTLTVVGTAGAGTGVGTSGVV
ncbi:MAG: hypothetical protein ABMA13_20000, partial [Chthoniobacteraceae bacterium]